ncbi:ankyrin repeat-containing domain protein [Rhypophila decipiens]|uniref:Ankyrin repeat-containing domain protein n=1 Tax=Rhypophila decipiens TaxID=261697 RepID=A0AAN7B8E1_9PEZI|nr:ankyrin repeat-containing domain protein [Rhypophila decipiens]
MSFGYSVGDFFAAAKIIHSVSKKIKDAPEEYRRLADEVKTLGIAIQEATTATAPVSTAPGNSSRLQELGKSCHDVLVRLERELDKHGDLGSSGGGSTPGSASSGSNIFTRIVGRPTRRGWQRFRFDPDEIRKVSDQLLTHLHSFNTLQLNNASQNITSVSTGVQQLNVGQVQISQNSEARKTILVWISPVDFTSTHQDIIYRRQEGTGEWFLNSAEYQTWLRSPGETLFCPGIPGSGKTMLTAIAIDHLEARFRKTTENVGIAYIFFSYKKEGSQGLMDVLASLLRQLCAYRHPLPAEIQELYKEYTKNSDRRLTRGELVDNLDKVAQSFSQVFIFFDALDECRQGSTLLSILSEMFGLQKKRRTVNLLATSRYIPEIMSEFNDRKEGRTTPVVEVRASEADVRKYLEGQSQDLLPFARRDKELQGQIVTKIVAAVQGMFLLAQLHFQSICNHTDKKSVLQALSRLQSGSNAYEIAYEEAMGRIKRQRAGPAELAFKALAWITCATRPLRTVELQHALAVEEGEDSVDEDKITDIDDLVSYCAGLVTVNKRSGIVRLVHYTTQEYFDRERKMWFPSADDDMAAVCLRYISMPVFEQGICASWPEFDLRMVRYPLYSYAAGYWGHHARENWPACKEVLNRFQLSDPKVILAAAQVTLFGELESPRTNILTAVTGLHLMTYFGLCGAVEYFVDGCWEGKPDARRTSDDQTLLIWAAKFGREDIARSLISKGADIQARDREGRSPVWWASCCGYGEIVRLLIEHGAKCHLKDSDGLDPLSIAVRYNHEEVICALLTGAAYLALASVNPRSGDTALMYACGYLHEEAVHLLKLFLSRGASCSRSDEQGRTVLHRAAEFGPSPEVLKLLLDAGADINARDICGWRPLNYALYCHPLLNTRGFQREFSRVQAGVDLLLAHGADVNERDIAGRTPLIDLAGMGLKEEARLLISAGADLDVTDRLGRRALWYAAQRGDEEMVEILLASGAKVFEGEKDPIELAKMCKETGSTAPLVDLPDPKGAFRRFYGPAGLIFEFKFRGG